MTKNRAVLLRNMLLVLIFVGTMCFSHISVHAREQFIVDAKLVNSDASDTYNVSITVENTGDDFSGTVRLLLSSNSYYYEPIAYDTKLSLSSGSVKQFNVRIPCYCITLDGLTSTNISFLTNRNKEIQSKDISYLFNNLFTNVNVGILSNDFSSLSFFDIGGATITYYVDDRHVDLHELSRDNLVDMLNDMDILIISEYNASSFSEDQITEIISWINNGGSLFIDCNITADGTYTFDLLDSFSDVTNGVKYSESDLDVMGFLYSQGYYYEEIGRSSESAGICVKDYGSGSVCVSFFPFSEIPYYVNSPASFAYELLDVGSNQSSARFSSMNTNYSRPDERPLVSISNNNSNYHPFIYVFILLIYVVLTGPLLYAVLKHTGKQEFYWVAVPIFVCVISFIIFIVSRGIRLSSTSIVSVSVENLDLEDKQDCYVMAMDSGYKEWSFKCADNISAAGPLDSDDIQIYGPDYLYHVEIKDNKYTIGAATQSPYQDVSFTLKRENMEDGQILVTYDDKYPSSYLPKALTISNQTGKDFEYYVVCYYDSFSDLYSMYIYKNLNNNTTVNLFDLKPVYETKSSYLYLNNLSLTIPAEKSSPLDALSFGMITTYEQEDFLVMGVVKDYPKVSDDFSKEVSYGCLYTTTIN